MNAGIVAEYSVKESKLYKISEVDSCIVDRIKE